jgi:3-oxoadipate enol-lactonase
VLCDTKAEPDTAEGRKVRDEQANLAEREGVAAVVDRLLPKLLGKTTQKTQPELVAEVREVILRSPVPGFAGALRAMRDRPDSTPDLAKIRVPTLVIGGSEDEIIAPSVMQAMAGAIPGGGAHFEPIKTAGHMAPLEQPLAVGRVLGEFLDSLPK